MGSPAIIANLIQKNRAPIVVLFYFDALVGPSLFTLHPQTFKEILKADLQNIASLMDVFRENETFQVCYGNTRLNVVNLIFHIHSDWARGMQEVCMISIIGDGCKNMIELYGPKLSMFKDRLIHHEDAYKSFYANNISKLKTHPEIKDVSQEIETLLKEFSESLSRGGT